MQYRITGTVGELLVDLVIEMPEQVRKQKRGVTVNGLSDDEVVRLIDESKMILGSVLAGQADLMVEMLAAQNKDGRMARTRTYREVWLPLRQALEGRYTKPALEHGMQVALEKGMPVSYAKAVARKWTGETPAPAPSIQVERKYKVV